MMTQPSDIYARLSQKYNLPIETIREVIIWFWRSGVKRTLESTTNKEIYINKLGSFKVKDYKLPYVYKSIESILNNPEKSEEIIEHFSGLKQRLILIQQMIEDNKIKNKEFRELFRENSTNISQSPPDLGGASKQTDKE